MGEQRVHLGNSKSGPSRGASGVAKKQMKKSRSGEQFACIVSATKFVKGSNLESDKLRICRGAIHRRS